MGFKQLCVRVSIRVAAEGILKCYAKTEARTAAWGAEIEKPKAWRRDVWEGCSPVHPTGGSGVASYKLYQLCLGQSPGRKLILCIF